MMAKPINDLTSKLCSTLSGAFFLYDLDQLKKNIELLKKKTKKIETIFYSLKANPNPYIIKELSQLGLGFDVSTESELNSVLKHGIAEDKITFSGPAKNNSVIEKIKKLNLYSVHIDSVEEFHLLNQQNVNLSLRYPLEDSFSQKVGIGLEQLKMILSNNQKRFVGIHIYIGRERAQADIVKKYVDLISETIDQFKFSFKQTPEVFWGGGLPLAEVIEAEMIPEFLDCKLHLESGRAIINSCGWYFAKVLAVKKREKNIVIIDGGLQHMATHFSSPRYNQTAVKTQFIKDGGQLSESNQTIIADIYGSLGIWSDVLVKDIVIPTDLKRGDWIGLNPIGAYGLTAGTNQFIGATLCKEFMLRDSAVVDVSAKNFISYLKSGIDAAQRI
jgi:diaminopimelate decarboxylase